MTTAYYRITADISVSSLVATITPSEIIPVDTDGADGTAISSLYSVIATGGDIKGNDCSGIINSISSAGVITTAASWYGSDATDAVLTVQNIPRGTALSQSTNEAISTFNNNETAVSECVRALDNTSVANAFLSLDGQINAYVLGVGTTTPPTSPSEGDAYVTGTSSTGVWSGYDNYFAYYINGDYAFKAPYIGMSVYNSVDGETYTYDGDEWSESTLPDSGVTAGTYKSVTVTKKGIVSSGTNPTTLSGYGITDAVSTDGSVTFSGAYSVTVTATAATAITLPTSGTLASLSDANEWEDDQTVDGSVIAEEAYTSSGSFTATADGTTVTQVVSGLTGLGSYLVTVWANGTNTVMSLVGMVNCGVSNVIAGVTTLSYYTYEYGTLALETYGGHTAFTFNSTGGNRFQIAATSTNGEAVTINWSILKFNAA